MDPANFRPISLQATTYKILAAVLARRQASWAIVNRRMSPSQKGFLPFEGCFEHGYLLRAAMEDSKRARRELRILWLDLKNAFGSVPHATMWEMLGVPASFIEFCQSIYGNSTFSIRTDAGSSSTIPLTKGIKQGCPLSPLLFNFVIEGTLAVVKRQPWSTGRILQQLLSYYTLPLCFCPPGRRHRQSRGRAGFCRP